MNTRLPSKITVAIPGEKPVQLTVLGVTESGDELFVAVAMPDGYGPTRDEAQQPFVADGVLYYPPSLPPFGEEVVCHRRWLPDYPGYVGGIRTETLRAKRISRQSWSTDEDSSKNCWWTNGDSLWSDVTVESWGKIPVEPRQPTPDELFAELENKAHAQTERAIAEIRGKIDAAAEAHTIIGSGDTARHLND